MAFHRISDDEGDCAAAVNRREFLTLRTSGAQRVLELSCEPLYMHYVDAQSRVAACAGGNGSNPVSHGSPGEPSTAIDLLTTGELFGELGRRLAEVDVLRVTGRDWLSGGDFRRRVELCLDTFISRGGQVEFGDAPSKSVVGGR